MNVIILKILLGIMSFIALVIVRLIAKEFKLYIKSEEYKTDSFAAIIFVYFLAGISTISLLLMDVFFISLITSTITIK
jgi:hypothetical protein